MYEFFITVSVNGNVSKWLDRNSTVDGLQYTYYVCTALMSSLSIFGCILILYYYFTIKPLQNRSRQLLVNLTICNLAIAIWNIAGIIM